MLLRVNSAHPIHDYLQTDVGLFIHLLSNIIYLFHIQGPLRFTDTRIKGDDWFFDCHAAIVLPHYLLSDALVMNQNKITVLVPEISKTVVMNILTFRYTGKKDILYYLRPVIHRV